MPLGKFVWKIKRKMNTSSPSLFSARELFPGNRRPSSPLPFPPQPSSPPLFPRSAQRQPPAHHRLARPSTAASNRRRAFLAPVAAASRAHLSEPPPSSRASRNRSGGHAATARAPLAHRGRPPAPRPLQKGSRAPPRAPPAAPAPFSPRPGRNCRTEEPRRPPISPSASPSSPSRHRLRFSPVVSSPWSPLPPHAFHFAFRGF